MDYFVRNNISKKQINKKVRTDKITKRIFLFFTLLCASIIVMIVFFIAIKGISPFIKYYQINSNNYRVNFWDFITGTVWFKSPNLYGIGFIIINTIYIVLFSLLIAIPCSVLTALLITKIAHDRFGRLLTTIVEILAAIPSIVYGVFGYGIINKFVKSIAQLFGLQTAGGISTLSTILVLAIMIIPTITMLSITSIKAVKPNIEFGSLALGASKTQTNFKVVLTSAKSGIFAGIILGVGRALGEATAVSMVAGNAGSGPNFSFFETTRTLTSTMLMGLKETVGLDYDIRFSVGLILILVILFTNILLNFVKRKIGRLS